MIDFFTRLKISRLLKKSQVAMGKVVCFVPKDKYEEMFEYVRDCVNQKLKMENKWTLKGYENLIKNRLTVRNEDGKIKIRKKDFISATQNVLTTDLVNEPNRVNVLIYCLYVKELINMFYPHLTPEESKCKEEFEKLQKRINKEKPSSAMPKTSAK